jgi:DNA-binding transcriptional regulator YhcF (GntR family)
MDLELSVDRSGDLPLGAQLTRALRDHVRSGRLRDGDRLPSLREAAGAAGVNVNTVRAVYARLEQEGLVHTEHGRGTFVAPRPGEAATRRQLHAEIARLEAELVRHPPPALSEPASPAAPALLSTADLQAVRDQLLDRLRELDAQRAALLQRLEQLGLEEVATEQAPPSRRATPSLAGARIRWVGA